MSGQFKKTHQKVKLFANAKYCEQIEANCEQFGRDAIVMYVRLFI